MSADVVGLIKETGDHPLNQAWCPGRHRLPWAPSRVWSDAINGSTYMVQQPRGSHYGNSPTRSDTDNWWDALPQVSDLLESIERHGYPWLM